MKGIEQKLELAPPAEMNIFKLSDSERQKMNIDCLPGSLEEAIREFEGSQLAKEILGEHIFNSLLINKKMEWDQYRVHVSNYELEKYLPWL